MTVVDYDEHITAISVDNNPSPSCTLVPEVINDPIPDINRPSDFGDLLFGLENDDFNDFDGLDEVTEKDTELSWDGGHRIQKGPLAEDQHRDRDGKRSTPYFRPASNQHNDSFSQYITTVTHQVMCPDRQSSSASPRLVGRSFHHPQKLLWRKSGRSSRMISKITCLMREMSLRFQQRTKKNATVLTRELGWMKCATKPQTPSMTVSLLSFQQRTNQINIGTTCNELLHSPLEEALQSLCRRSTQWRPQLLFSERRMPSS